MLKALELSRLQLAVALLYHKIDERPGDPSAEIVPALARSLFEAQLRYLAAYYDVVPASRLLAATRARRRGRRFPVAITFDDDLPTHVSFAAPALETLGVRGAFFVCGASLETPHAFWWETLQRASDTGVDGLHDLVHAYADEASVTAPGEPRLRGLAAMIEEMPAVRRDALVRELETRIGTPATATQLSVAEVGALATAHEIGFHTRRHESLDLLDDSALERAVRDGRAAVEAAAGSEVRMIAYPHGRADARVAAAAGRAGYEVGFGGGWGPARATTDPLLIPRVSAPPSHVPSFALRLSIMLARAAGRSARHR